MSQGTDDKIKPFTIGELFSSSVMESDNIYRIPLYQRNFSWGKPEVKQLIRDIVDFAHKRSDQNYYLGILVVYERKADGQLQYEVVDGQQRLTVLSLLMRAFHNEQVSILHKTDPLYLKLNFAHRPKAQQTLRAISLDSVEELDEKNTHHEINRVYEHIPLIIKEEIADVGCTEEDFYSYLINNVILYRSSLPGDTELNHYFEVMNNRGEQLEKHEILKADLMSTAGDDDQLKATINQVWEACSDMNRYVQYSFPKDNRVPLFGEEWNTPTDWFNNDSYERLSALISSNGNGESDALSINEILRGEKPDEPKSRDEDRNPDRFQPVINFPNFLIQVLRIYQNKFDDFRLKDVDDKYASLDDKVLLEQFEQYVGDITFVKRFTVLLLKLRYLLDQFVVKRSYEGDKDEWTLLKLNYYPETSNRKQDTTGYKNTFGKDDGFDEYQNERVLKLLTMLHVSTPTQNYKHWLTGVLSYLEREQKINADNYINHIESFARKLFFDRFMVADKELQSNYESIVFRTSEEMKELQNQKIDEELLRFSKVKNNLVFNYLDYLIWREYSGDDDRVKNFEFKFRSSVEHFNPRNPREHSRLDEQYLNSFGNLCLIAHGKNSAFGNNNPLAKAHSDTTKTSLDSLKLHFMMKMAKDEGSENSKFGGWGPTQVEKHEDEMIKMYRVQLDKKL